MPADLFHPIFVIRPKIVALRLALQYYGSNLPKENI